MTKQGYLLIAIALIVIVLLFSVYFFQKFFSVNINPEVFVNEENLSFSANNMQFDAESILFSYNNQLYLCTTSNVNHRYANSLAVFYDGSINRISKWTGKNYIGFSKGFVYYWTIHRPDWSQDVYCVSLNDMSTTFLTNATFDPQDVHFDLKGNLYLPSCEEANSYFIIEGDQIIGTADTEYFYQLKDRSYVLRGYDNAELICITNTEETNLNGIVPDGPKVLIPCANGLLLQTDKTNLHFIDEQTGAIREIFSAECIDAECAINLYNEYVFLSLLRYEKIDESGKGMVRFENDTIEGTYRFNLQDGSATKISDHIYTGLFIFGKNAIYAVDEEDCIFQLDFDGTVTKEILTKGGQGDGSPVP